MATYQPPTENLIAFNSSVFKTANESTLTLSEATSLFLARVGTASSEAISTSFTNDIFVNRVRAGAGLYRPVADVSMNTCFGRNALGKTTSAIMNTAVGNTALAELLTGTDNSAFGNKALNALTSGIRNVAVGANSLVSITTGSRNTAVGQATGQVLGTSASDNTFIGYNSGNSVATTGSFNTFVGAGSGLLISTAVNGNTFIGAGTGRSGGGVPVNSTGIGYQATCNYSTSTVIGYQSSASAPNQIMLGTATETVECPGTANSISLKAARNISINGAVFGIGSGETNSLFCGLTVGTAAYGENNTIYGRATYDAATDGSSDRNTIIGANASNTGYSVMSDHTVVGYGAGGKNSTGSQQGITCLGSGANVLNNASNSTAIGFGAQATLASQIMLGTTSETVYCPGTNVSLYTTKNISVNGIGVGIGFNAIGSNNIYIGRGDASEGKGGNNTIVGRNAYSQALAYTGVYNTFLGSGSCQNVNTILNYNTIIGGNCYSSSTNYDNVSCLGYGCSIGGADSTAIGYGATTSVANQIMLGRTSEFVEIAGTDSSKGSLKLNGGLILQQTYAAVPTSLMLGYNVKTTTLLATVTGATGAVALNVLSNTIPTIGIYLCEASIYYNTSVASFYVFCSISTTSATLNSNNQTNVFTSAAVQTNQVVRTTAVITTTSANTVLYAVGQSGAASQTIASGFLQFTRIA